MANKEITINELAETVNKLATTVDNLAKTVEDGFAKTATKEDLREEIEGLARMVKTSFDGVDKRFDKLEAKVDGHKERIEKLEGDTKELREMFAV